jgi:drug/metabolite transporter (DMT)-like permease
MKNEGDHVGVTIAYGLVSSAMILPLALLDFRYSLEPVALIAVLAASISWAVFSVLQFESQKFVEASKRTPIYRTRLIWVALLGFLLFGDAMPLQKILGIILLLSSALVVIGKWQKIYLGDEGIALTLASSIAWAASNLLDKAAIPHYSPGVYSFLMFFLPTVCVSSVMKDRRRRLQRLWKEEKTAIVALSFLVAVSYTLSVVALSTTEVSNVLPVADVGIIVTMLGGIIFLHERSDLGKKIISMVLTMAGAFLVATA